MKPTLSESLAVVTKLAEYGEKNDISVFVESGSVHSSRRYFSASVWFRGFNGATIKSDRLSTAAMDDNANIGADLVTSMILSVMSLDARDIEKVQPKFVSLFEIAKPIISKMDSHDYLIVLSNVTASYSKTYTDPLKRGIPVFKTVGKDLNAYQIFLAYLESLLHTK